MNSDLELLLEGIPAFRALPADATERLEQALTRKTCRAGDYLFQEGEDQDFPHVFYLLSATAEILVGPPDEQRAVSLSRPGQLVGWITVFSKDPFPASARVVDAGEVIAIDAPALGELLDDHPSVSTVLAASMARRIQDLFQEMRVETTVTPFDRVETFAFKKKVSEVMSSPVVTAAHDDTAKNAAKLMREEKTSSLIVTDQGRPVGIVTEKDLVQRILVEDRPADTTPIGEIMTSPLQTLAPDEYLYKAFGLMRGRGIRHLPVIDGDRLVGVVSMRALMSMSKASTLQLAQNISGAANIEELTQASNTSRTVCASLLEEGANAQEVSRLLSYINRDIHRRVLEISIAKMRNEGRGEPPVPFCFIVMGSHGRAENHFNTDQDHGMILADYPDADWHRVEPYFMDLSVKLNDGLAACGFAYCDGNVMSSNPIWRKKMSEWKDQVRGWFSNPNSNTVRYTTLFYDFAPVWGDAWLAEELRNFITDAIQRNYSLLRSLFDEASQHKVPLTFFKGFITEKSGPHKGELDLKKSGLLFVVECARILALQNGVTTTSTLKRIKAAEERGVIPADEGEFVRTAYASLFHFLLESQIRSLRQGQPTTNFINPTELPIQERYILRHALEATSRLQSVVHASFGDIFF